MPKVQADLNLPLSECLLCKSICAWIASCLAAVVGRLFLEDVRSVKLAAN